MEIRLDDEVRPLVRLGVLELEGVRAGPAGPVLEEHLRRRAAEIRRDWSGQTAGEIPALRAARELYRAAGIDPTRRRPSSEALVRRVLRGEELPRINAAVDLSNLAAVTDFLPIGLYDAGRIAPPVVARLGRAGEAYEGLGKPEVHLAGRFCLADGEGPFGNPSSDSRRTGVDAGTRRLLWVAFAPFAYPSDRLLEGLDRSAALAVEAGLCPGPPAAPRLLGGP